MSKSPINVLLFSTLFPHEGEPTLGIFVENRLKNLLEHENVKATVIAPVPWFPFRHKLFGGYARSAKAQVVETRGELTVYHPRYLVIPKVGMLLTPWFLYRSAWRVLKKLLDRGEVFDLIDAHYFYTDAVAAKRLAAVARLPYIVTARGSDVTQIALMNKPRKLILSAIQHASHAITVSANLRRDLVSMGACEGKISVLRNGVDLVRFKETNREAGRQRYPSGKIMLFAGWLIPRKRL
ncbi:MAG: glycosyltransferase, partial [Kordiimonas sp.]